MKLSARSVAWLLPLLLTGCIHWPRHRHVQALPPPIQPVPKPTTTRVELPPSALTIPGQPLASADIQLPETSPKPQKRHRRLAGRNAQEPAPNPPGAPGENPGVSAIGRLSSGDPSDLRSSTMDLIVATERGLNGIDRSLSSQEQATAAQIRDFLRQARDALASGDLDGAHTLAVKAKVLLSELTP